MKIPLTLLFFILITKGYTQADQKSPSGFWSDGRAGDHMSLYLASDGTGDLISQICRSLSWKWDTDTNTVTLTVKPNHRELTLQFDPSTDTLILKDDKSYKDRIFQGDDQHIDWWLKVKSQNKSNG